MSEVAAAVAAAVAIPESVRDVRARVRAFVDDRILPHERLLETEGPGSDEVLAELQAAAKREGLWALGLPRELGGGGLSFLEYAFVNEVIGRSAPAQVVLGTHVTQDALMLYEHGSAEQKERWLEPLCRGEIYPSVGMTEPEAAGSDPTLIRATARLEGDEWVIDAHKWFITYANRAAFTTVFCVTEPDADPHRRASMIVVPTDVPGYELVRDVPTMGSTAGHHCEIRLTGVRVPRGNLLGGRGEGFVIAQRRLGPGRIFHAMRWLGQAQRAFDLMCERALARYAHGSPLAEKQSIQNFVAESAADIQAARLLTLDAARKLDAGEDARVEIALIKFRGAQMLHDVVDRAIQVHGALGLTSDTPLEAMYRRARYARIYDGPDEVHRVTVARRILRRYGEGGSWDFSGG